MKKKKAIVGIVILMFFFILMNQGTAQENQILLSAPPETDEGGQFQVKALLVPGGVGEPPESGVVTIEFLGEEHQTNRDGIVLLIAPLVDRDTEYQITARREGYSEESVWITVEDTSPPPTEEQPQLQISVLSSVSEGELFQVTITANDIPIQSATVTFYSSSYETGNMGLVQFTAPLVDENTAYSITARKIGYRSATTMITVLHQEEQVSTSWIYGRVSTTSGDYVEGAQICIINAHPENCTLTDTQGVYNFSVPPDTYMVTASKEGYTTKVMYHIEISENVAYEVNFIFDRIEEGDAQETYDTGDLTIQWGIVNKQIGAQITATPELTQSSIYNTELSLTVSSLEDKKIIFTISGPDGTEGTAVALRISKNLFGSSPSELTTIVVTIDGIPVQMATSFDDFFNPSMCTSDPLWAAVVTGENITALVKIPHFSEHTITIIIPEIVQELHEPLVIIIYLLTSIVTGIIFLTRIFTHPVYRNYFKKRKMR